MIQQLKMSALGTLVGTCLLSAQDPLLRLQPTATPGQSLQTLLLGLPAQGFATYADVSGTQSPLLGTTAWLGLTPALSLVDTGRLDAIGARVIGLQTPAQRGLIGLPLYLQSFVLDSNAQNGVFRASNGQSAILHGRRGAMVFEFRDALAEGVRGDYDTSTLERLMAASPTRRVQTIEPAAGLPFPQPIQTPLNPRGSRMQHAYRAIDIGATGQPEYVVEMRWKPLGQIVSDTFPRVAIALAHSTIVPDYSIDPFTALPRFPNSGLGLTFANNVRANEQPVTVYDGGYTIDASNRLPDGYLPWPAMQRAFRYNGADTLLIDYRAVGDAQTIGANGFSIRLMVQSDRNPNARVYAPGFQRPPVDPFRVTVADEGDNGFYDLQLVLVDATSEATTRYLPVGSGAPIFGSAYVAGSQPRGTSMSIEYEAATDANGANASGFVRDAATLPALPFLRVRVRFEANPIDGGRPSIDTIVLPFN